MRPLAALLLTAFPTLCQDIIFIDCGSPFDQFFTGGAPYTIANTTGDPTLRYGAFSYKIPVPDGAYTVSLLFRETGTVSAKGQRIFSVAINSTPVLSNYDLFSLAGLLERRRDFTATSDEGFLYIDFTYTRKSAIVSQIVVTPYAPPDKPPPPSGPIFIDQEVPTGPTDGANVTFTLSSTPSPAASLYLTRNGLTQKRGYDYTLSGTTITFVPLSVPSSGDTLLASYRK